MSVHAYFFAGQVGLNMMQPYCTRYKIKKS
jgi:hypothetical protein